LDLVSLKLKEIIILHKNSKRSVLIIM